MGTTHDLCQDEQVPITAALGYHPNDQMVSFYAQTPSGFQFVLGHGGREINDDTWQVEVYHAASVWGHRPPASSPAVELAHAG